MIDVRHLARLVWLLASLAAPLVAEAGHAVVTLPRSGTTSAGVFDANGRLVRTLWRAEPKAAGPVAVEWDGLDDDGLAVAASQPFTARIVVHDVRYSWDGVIGNTSRDSTGT